MTAFRDRLRKARETLHSHLGVPALYFPYPGHADYGAFEPIGITVRIHDHYDRVGDLKGTNFNYAEVEENSPRIVFLAEQIIPARNYVVSVSEDTMYRVDSLLPPHGITITALAARLTKNQCQGLPYPDE